ncbi:hypothetical protein SNE35_29650 [Paucibacter sp. R3-3]|uniref:PIN domain-containing protein n=1 Tax=Roseateles agri TaxID=3098619 RepID=A0ABU5DQV2_9BURK|nr:hypothetical protein [Paucibacter sp. R3-3]MDY0748700.1 hypothetical protein [Paucibacter sp. R3-3]
MQHEITKPTDDSAFEDMCARVYGEVFQDATPKINGRRGQAQAGVDVFVNSAAGRVGIQAKRYVDGALTLKDVEAEVSKADKGKAPIVRLIVATTAASDVKLLRAVQARSDRRVAAGQFSVDIEFWDDICRHIRGSAKLQRDYAPNSPGATFDEMREGQRALHAASMRMESKIDVLAGLPAGRPDSVNTYMSGQLDAINEQLKACRFKDASEQVKRIGANMELLDAHQQARWYVQRGFCAWHLDDEQAAAQDFLKAAQLYPDDEKMAAAGIRGLLMTGDPAGALAAGGAAVGKFPASAHVWTAYANARLANDDKVTYAPAALKTNCDVLQMLALGRKAAGDIDGALETIAAALDLPEAGFFARRNALALAVEAATQNAYGAFVVPPGKIRSTLERAVAEFAPRRDRLWSIQSATSRDDAVVQLGFALILLGQPEEALKVFDEAQHADAVSPRLKRVALEAYRRLDRLDELIANGRAWIEALDEDALILLGEVAADSGDVALVDAVARRIRNVPRSSAASLDVLSALRWVALWQSKDGRAQALREVQEANLATTDSLPLICAGARVLHHSDLETERDAAIERGRVLVKSAEGAQPALQFADLLFATGNFSEAATFYEQHAPKNPQSELQVRLLTAYVRGGARKKAKELLASMPGDWAADDDVRRQALELGQQAADWEFLIPLAERQRERAPNSSGAWLLNLYLDLKTGKMLRFHQDLEALPRDLKGVPRQIGQVAALELKYDRQLAGMKRLFRMFRQNMDDVEAASAFFICIVAGRGDLPDMEDSLPEVAPGSTVHLQDEFGGKLTVSIDPIDVGPLTARDGFYPHDHHEVQALLGAPAGAVVELPAGLGMTRKYTVAGILSTYRHALHIAQSKLHSSISTDAAVTSVPVPSTEEGADFSHMHEVLKRQSAHAKAVMDAYRDGPLTLGLFARMLGRSATEVVAGWPNIGPSMFVCNGTMDERKAVSELLDRVDAVYVIDAVTIAELVWLRAQDALAVFPKLYCTTKTLETLEAGLEEIKTDRARGTIYDDDGVMRFEKFDERRNEKRLESRQAMVDVVGKYCQVVPAYGPDVLPEGMEQAEDTLEAEEYSVLLLVAELGATLMTVDGRLAQLAQATFKTQTIWPQPLLVNAVAKEIIAPTAYRMAILQEFIGNRSFISITAIDLSMMIMQGGYFLHGGLQKFKEYLASPIADIAGAIQIAFDFMRLQAAQNTQIKAFSELLGHIVEAIARHPECDARQLQNQLEGLIQDLTFAAAGEPMLYPLAEVRRGGSLRAILELLGASVKDALDLASLPERRRAIKLRTLKCTRIPYLVFDGTVPEPESASPSTVGGAAAAPPSEAAASEGRRIEEAYLIDAREIQGPADVDG